MRNLNPNLIKGFTLIELLVVIAIIGILSTVVLGQLSQARAKSVDAQKKSNFKNMNNAGIIFFETAGNYNGVCNDTVTHFQDMVNIAGASGSCSSYPGGYKVRTQLRYEDKLNAVGASIPDGTKDWICTDQRGNIQYYGADPGGGNTNCT